MLMPNGWVVFVAGSVPLRKSRITTQCTRPANSGVQETKIIRRGRVIAGVELSRFAEVFCSLARVLFCRCVGLVWLFSSGRLLASGCKEDFVYKGLRFFLG